MVASCEESNHSNAWSSSKKSPGNESFAAVVKRCLGLIALFVRQPGRHSLPALGVAVEGFTTHSAYCVL